MMYNVGPRVGLHWIGNMNDRKAKLRNDTKESAADIVNEDGMRERCAQRGRIPSHARQPAGVLGDREFGGRLRCGSAVLAL
jgi:hypothetical protein